MRADVPLGALLLVALLSAGCIGTFNHTLDEHPATVDDGHGGGPLLPPPPKPMLKPTVAPVVAPAPWVLNGTQVEMQAVAPADAKAPLSWTWGVAPLLGTAPLAQKATGLDTGSKKPDDYLSPGQSASLTFSLPGVYQMHCHPHANFMRGNVTVIDGLPGAKNFDVYIEDGATYKDFRFVPENLTVPAGSVVTYHNVGSQAHSATLLSQDPGLVPQPVTGSKGTVTLTGNGWTRVIAILHDAEGRIGQAEWPVYVAPYPEDYQKTFYQNFSAGAPAQLDAAPVSVAPGGTLSFKTDYNGTAFVNVTFLDPPSQQALPAADPANACAGEFHLREQGSQTDLLTGAQGPSPAAHGRVLTTTYNLVVVPRQGASCEAIVQLHVLYDHEPPAPLAYVDPESVPHHH